MRVFSRLRLNKIGHIRILAVTFNGDMFITTTDSLTLQLCCAYKLNTTLLLPAILQHKNRRK